MLIYEELTALIIKSYYKVYNKLGFGFLEKVYENALLVELRNMGLNCLRQHPIEVYYDGTNVGNYYADIVVEDKIIIEIKAGEGDLIEAHELQLINYLKATDKELGLIFFFGKKPIFKRKIFTNNNKSIC